MKLTKKTRGSFAWMLFLGLMIGTLVWELAERLLALAGVDVTLAVGPVGFDVGVLSMYLKVNPGSLMGIPAGLLLFRRI